MLTTRSFLLTAAGLFTAFLASAQATAPAGPQPTDIMSWITWAAAGVVLLLAVLTAASATSAAQRRYTEAPAEETTAPAAVPTAPAPMMAATTVVPAPVFAEAATAEAVAA
ncbi:MAG TPA: hypothetical protein VF690_05875 [Hymenobacter sp.]|jgi:heme/copper-type cytochrome/quinol oxidase subunit 3